MPVPQLPPEAFRLDETEILNLTIFDSLKRLGGLAVAADEAVPATGWDPAVGENGLVIPRGAEAVVIHAQKITGAEKARHDLVQAGTYVALHPQLSEREFVVGVTFEPVARLAVRAAGFSLIRPHGQSEEYQTRLEGKYGDMRLSARRPFKLAMVYMPTEQFVHTFANRRLGRDAQALWNIMTFGSED